VNAFGRVNLPRKAENQEEDCPIDEFGTLTDGLSGVLGGRSPTKFEVGDGPCIREAKYELTKKRSQRGIFCLF